MEFLDISSLGVTYQYVSKSSRSLNKRRDSLGLQTPHNRSREKASPTHRTKGRARMENLRKTSPKKGRHIIDAEPSATIATTTKVQPNEPDEPEEGEHLFHSQMWVKGTPLHFIIDRSIQKNLISIEVIKRLALSTSPHPQPYTIRWLCQGSDLCVSQQCCLTYDIKPFKDEVFCDVSPLC
jgi:hypothetical protein